MNAGVSRPFQQSKTFISLSVLSTEQMTDVICTQYSAKRSVGINRLLMLYTLPHPLRVYLLKIVGNRCIAMVDNIPRFFFLTCQMQKTAIRMSAPKRKLTLTS